MCIKPRTCHKIVAIWYSQIFFPMNFWPLNITYYLYDTKKASVGQNLDTKKALFASQYKITKDSLSTEMPLTITKKKHKTICLLIVLLIETTKQILDICYQYKLIKCHWIENVKIQERSKFWDEMRKNKVKKYLPDKLNIWSNSIFCS